MTSHYPTAQELAAFRRSIPGSWVACDYRSPACRPVDGSLMGAWPDERRDGIGYVTVYGSDGRGHAPDPIWSSDWRREASAVRSRAYACIFTAEPIDAPVTDMERWDGIPSYANIVIPGPDWSGWDR